MLKLSEVRFFRFLSFMLIISTYLPILFVNLPPIVRSHHIWTFLWIMSLLLFKPKIFLIKPLFITIIYGIGMLLLLNILWANVNHFYRVQVMKEFYNVAIGISVLAYFYLTKDYYGLALIAKWSIIFIVITAIMSIITSYISPMYARDITGSTALTFESERQEVLSYRRFGGGTYSFASAIVGLFPILIYYYKNNSGISIKKKYILGVIVLLFFTLIRVQFFANIIIASVTIIFSMIGSSRIRRPFLVIGFIAIVLLYVPIQWYSDLLVRMGEWFSEESDIHYKFNDVATFIISGNFEDTGTGDRVSRFPALIESFLSNPLIGGNYWNIHLHWLNKFAVFGIIGSLPFLYILYYFIKRNYVRFKKDFGFFFLLATLSIFSLGIIKALVGRDLWYVFLIIIPGSYYLPLLNQKKKRTLTG